MTHAAGPVANPDNDTIVKLLKDAKTIAVVGASRHPEKEAHTVPAFMQAQGYRIIPINPAGGEILGETAYASLEDIPEELRREIDLVNLFRPGDQVGPHIKASIDMNLPALWLQLGIRNDDWARRAKEAGLTVIQDSCIRVAYTVYAATAED